MSKAQLKAEARGERHRISTELHTLADAVSFGDVEPDDAVEPGSSWKPEQRHDAERVAKRSEPGRFRHWKMKDWKRRSARRKAKAQAFRLADES